MAIHYVQDPNNFVSTAQFIAEMMYRRSVERRENAWRKLEALNKIYGSNITKSAEYGQMYQEAFGSAPPTDATGKPLKPSATWLSQDVKAEKDMEFEQQWGEKKRKIENGLAMSMYEQEMTRLQGIQRDLEQQGLGDAARRTSELIRSNQAKEGIEREQNRLRSLGLTQDATLAREKMDMDLKITNLTLQNRLDVETAQQRSKLSDEEGKEMQYYMNKFSDPTQLDQMALTFGLIRSGGKFTDLPLGQQQEFRRNLMSLGMKYWQTEVRGKEKGSIRTPTRWAESFLPKAQVINQAGNALQKLPLGADRDKKQSLFEEKRFDFIQEFGFPPEIIP